MTRVLRLGIPVLALSLLAACASQPARNEPVYGGSRSGSPSAYYGEVAYGQVRSIESIGPLQDQPQGAGAVAGAIVGGVVGRQFADSSHGRNVGTIVGAVGGALIGNEIEKNARRDSADVRVVVQLERGGTRSFDFKSAGDLRVGDRVRIEGDRLYRM
jgi:outer membrane lipoprotein SlyB